MQQPQSTPTVAEVRSAIERIAVFAASARPEHLQSDARQLSRASLCMLSDVLQNHVAFTGGFVSAEAAGKVKWNVDPQSRSLLTQIRPPCDSMIDLQIARPIPLPCGLVVKISPVLDHTDTTIQTLNGTVNDIRDPTRQDLIELQTTLKETTNWFRPCKFSCALMRTRSTTPSRICG